MIEDPAVGAASLIVAALVTSRLHAGGGFWSRRLGRTRFRRANLPVGAAGAALAAGVCATAAPVAVEPLLVAAGVMGAVAVGWRWVDPLPPIA